MQDVELLPTGPYSERVAIFLDHPNIALVVPIARKVVHGTPWQERALFILLFTSALAIALFGGGTYSLDHLINWESIINRLLLGVL